MRKYRSLSAFIGVLKFSALLCVVLPVAALAIPPNTPISNTAVATFQVDSVDYSVSASDTIVTDPASGNSPPSGVGIDPNVIDENLDGGVVGTLSAIDLDPSDTHTYAVTDPRFLVSGDQLSLAPGVVLDHETEPQIAIDVQVADTAGASGVFTLLVEVADVNEPPAALALSSSTFEAGTDGAAVGDLSVTDPDVGDSHVYSVDDVRFEVTGSTLKLIDGQALPLDSTVDLLVSVTDAAGLIYQSSFTVKAVPPGAGGIGAGIALLQYAPAMGSDLSVPVGRCDAGAGYADLPVPISYAGDALALPGVLPLVDSVFFKSGQPVFIRVDDPDANLDGALADLVEVQVSSNGDTEQLQLRETGIATGVFAGYLQTTPITSAAPNNCLLESGLDVTVQVDYRDALDPTDVAQAEAILNPVGQIIYSRNGQPIDDAQITLVNSASGAPAGVGGETPGSRFPATLRSGGEASDDAGASYDFGPGEYRFPVTPAGDYQLLITPPNRFRFPSGVADEQLQLLPDGPYLLAPGSRGQTFTVSGLNFALDIPLDLAPIVPTPASLALLALDSAGSPGSISASQCFTGGVFTPSPAPTNLDGSVIVVPGELPLSDVGRLARGEVLFLRLTDADEDADPFAADVVEVRVGVPGSVEEERVQLLETGSSTGEFTGYLQTSVGSPVANDCALQGAPGVAFSVSYSDADDATDSVSRSALLDPPFTVISSADGGLVDGAIITLINTVTGQDATVFSEDGVTAFPATVTSGASAVDAAGNEIDFAPGTFYYPVIVPGTYRLEVEAPQAYQFPSTVSDDELNALPSGPFALTEGSRGEEFVVAAGADTEIEFDVPLDPLALDLFVSKQASKDVVAIGDFLQYQILVQNPDPQGGAVELAVLDRLPAGFRYVEDSTQIDGVRAADPMIADDGVTMTFAYGGLGPGQSLDIRYVVEVTAAAELGRARNEAQVGGIGVASSNVAFADVLVREDLLQSKAIIVGQVIADSCDDASAEGLAGVRVWLEDGTYVVTDADGKYHIEGVEPGSHVVQLDTDTLPSSYEAFSCEQNTRFGGSTFSQFIDVQAGSLWRADFHARRKTADQDFVRSQLLARAIDERIDYRLVVAGGEVPVADLVALVMLDEAVSLISGSLRIDGESVADPAVNAGTMTVRLGDETDTFEREITFSGKVPVATDTVTTKSIVMFRTDTAGKQKSPVMAAQLQFNWPDSLTAIGASAAAASAEFDSPREIAAGVYEPSRGQLSASSDLTKVAVTADVAEDAAAYTLPEVDNADAPSFDRVWLASQSVGNQLLWPLPDHNPRIPAITVATKHELGLELEVRVNGAAVNPLSYMGIVADRRQGVAVSRWDNVAISEGENLIEVIISDDSGEEVARMRSNVHFSGRPVRAEFVPEASYLVADGITPPVIAVRLFDRDDHPARPGLSGEFSLQGEFTTLNPGKELDKLGNSKSQGYERYLVRKDGIAYIQLEPTSNIGEVRVFLEFDDMRNETIKARLVPGSRDWILVGLVEGMLGYNDVSGNMDAFRQSDLDDDLVTDGRTAFYAKGRVPGDWLLTAAYDTDKDTGDRLRQQIDPNRFYTLYGDGTEQRYDAESNSKLYLKVDRQSFSALWGDFDTGYDDTELTKFTRTLNGLQVSNYSEQWQLSGFASSTDQGFIRDQIPGDGTSGIYQLSTRQLLVNSERVSIVVRDRFHLEQVIEETSLTRYLDYTIDYDQGTLIFKQPVFSKDNELNPIFIEAEYEVATEGGDELVAGGRIAYRLDDQDSRVALTYVDDNTEGREGNLVGMDLSWDLPGGTTVRAEAATTDTDINGSAYAYLLEAEHQSVNLAGRTYLREQEAAFGLGQQSALEGGTRKYGLEADYDVGDVMTVRGEMYRQEDINGGGDRTVIGTEAFYSMGEAMLSSGLRTVSETVAEGDTRDAQQVTLGISRNFLDDRLIMRGDAELALGEDENTDFPNRSILGAEYVVSEDVSLIAEQEFTWGDTRNTQDSRVGVRARPWSGGDVSSMVAREMTENGERVFATTGLLQQWQISDSWRMDMGADRVQTIKSDPAAEDSGELLYDPNIPPVSGSVNNDFTAMFGGIGYRQDDWDASMRLEYHHGDQLDKWNYLAGVSKQLADGKITSASLSTRFEELDSGAERNQIDLRWGLAWRPSGARWMVLNRLDLVFDETSNEVFDTKSRKAVNNMNVNIEPALGGQLSLQLGLKYLVDTIDGEDYDGYTGLYGLEYRRDFNPRWDWGVHGSVLHSVKSSVLRYSSGLSIGHSVFKNTWLSVGYNVSGFEDDDFTAADYTAQGPYMKFRMKLDQGHLEKFLGFVGQSRR